jgi:hypothetical protein
MPRATMSVATSTSNRPLSGTRSWPGRAGIGTGCPAGPRRDVRPALHSRSRQPLGPVLRAREDDGRDAPLACRSTCSSMVAACGRSATMYQRVVDGLRRRRVGELRDEGLPEDLLGELPDLRRASSLRRACSDVPREAPPGCAGCPAGSPCRTCGRPRRGPACGRDRAGRGRAGAGRAAGPGRRRRRRRRDGASGSADVPRRRRRPRRFGSSCRRRASGTRRRSGSPAPGSGRRRGRAALARAGPSAASRGSEARRRRSCPCPSGPGRGCRDPRAPPGSSPAGRAGARGSPRSGGFSRERRSGERRGIHARVRLGTSAWCDLLPRGIPHRESRGIANTTEVGNEEEGVNLEVRNLLYAWNR